MRSGTFALIFALALPVVGGAARLAAAQTPPTSAATGGASLTVTELVTGIQRNYGETRDLTADFQQSYLFKVTGRAKKSAGRVFIKMPGKMRWDYTSPEAKHFVADGHTLWVITPGDRQAMRQPVEQSDISGVLGFLMGSGDLAKQFDLSLLGRDPAGRYRLRLMPRREETHYRQVVLVIDPRTFRTVETEVTDPAGNLNHLVFAAIKVNQGLPDSGFAVQIPAGYRIIEAAAAGERTRSEAATGDTAAQPGVPGPPR